MKSRVVSAGTQLRAHRHSPTSLALMLFFGFYCFDLQALSLEFPVDKLVDSSSDVATIEIIGGRSIERNGIACGNEFIGRVTDVLKGSNSGTITFGSSSSLEIGKRYFTVLITRSTYIDDNDWLLPTVTNHYDDEAKKDRAFSEWQFCKKNLPLKMVGAFGEAAMPIEQPPELGYLTPAVKVPLSIWLPPGTKCTKALSVNDHDKGRWAVWITPEELRRIFKIVIDRPPGTKIVGGPGKYAISPSDCDDPIKRSNRP